MRAVIYSVDQEFVSTFVSASTEIEFRHVRSQAELLHECVAQTLELAIIDGDAGPASTETISTVRRQSANRECVIFAATGAQPTESLIAAGASVALKKPVSVEIARRHLRDVLLVTDGERRQYYRVPLTGPIHLHSVSDGKIDGELVNIGEGGLALKLARVPTERATVEVVFRLPGVRDEFRAPGKISWADRMGNVGIRFGAMEPNARYRLSDWIVAAEKQSQHPA
jgi:hypothetical protein